MKRMLFLHVFANVMTAAMRWVDRGIARGRGAAVMLAPLFGLQGMRLLHATEQRWRMQWFAELASASRVAVATSFRQQEAAT